MGGGSWCFNSGMPSSMVERRSCMLSLDDVAVWTCSQLTVCVECKEDRSDSCSWFSIRIECSWSSVHMPAMSWVGIWGGGVTVLSWMLCMSSWRTILGGW